MFKLLSVNKIEPPYYKIISAGYNKGMDYKIGLNEDLLLENSTKNHFPFGLYFTNKDYIHNYIGYGSILCEIELCEDSVVCYDNGFAKTNKFIIINMYQFKTSLTLLLNNKIIKFCKIVSTFKKYDEFLDLNVNFHNLFYKNYRKYLTESNIIIIKLCNTNLLNNQNFNDIYKSIKNKFSKNLLYFDTLLYKYNDNPNIDNNDKFILDKKHPHVKKFNKKLKEIVSVQLNKNYKFNDILNKDNKNIYDYIKIINYYINCFRYEIYNYEFIIEKIGQIIKIHPNITKEISLNNCIKVCKILDDNRLLEYLLDCGVNNLTIKFYKKLNYNINLDININTAENLNNITKNIDILNILKKYKYFEIFENYTKKLLLVDSIIIKHKLNNSRISSYYNSNFGRKAVDLIKDELNNIYHNNEFNKLSERHPIKIDYNRIIRSKVGKCITWI